MMDQYQKQYVDIKFERCGLFEFICEEFRSIEALYPGCSVHLTPAFFFPFVVFVDHSPEAVEFFSNRESLLNLIRRQRRYRRSPYIQFIAQDFTDPLPIRKDQFDLVLSLYTAGVSTACASYLKVGGILVSNNHHNDAVEADREEQLTLIAEVQETRGHYRFMESQPGGELKRRVAHSRTKPYLRQSTGGFEYIDNERYYIFQKIRH